MKVAFKREFFEGSAKFKAEVVYSYHQPTEAIQMPNMSYCRFENTLSALVDCLNALEEEGMDTLDNRYEREAATSLYAVASKFRKVYEAAQSAEVEREMGLLPE